jgi:hypothetical protein
MVTTVFVTRASFASATIRIERMLDQEFKVYKVTYTAEYMDMSAGDDVDDPRWTGGYVEYPGTVLVVAATEDFAAAYVISVCGERDGGTKVVGVENIGECAGIVDLIDVSGKRPTIVRPFSVKARNDDDQP